MITQEEIDKAAYKWLEENKKDITAFTPFQAGVQWVLQNLNEKSNAKINRFEVIDHSNTKQGRCYVKHDCSIELSLQDSNKTLKAFVNDEG